MSLLGQRFVSVCETISVANYLLHRLIKQSNSLFFGCVFFKNNNSNTPNWTNLSSCDVRLLMPPYMSFCICMKWGSFQGHKSSFWTFLFCSTCFHQSKCFFFLKMITNRFGWAIQIARFWFTMALSCIWGMLCWGIACKTNYPTWLEFTLLRRAFVCCCCCLFLFFFVEAEMGTFVVQLVTCMQHSRFPPICFQTCKLRSPSVWVYGNEMQKHGPFVFTHVFPKLK